MKLLAAAALAAPLLFSACYPVTSCDSDMAGGSATGRTGSLARFQVVEGNLFAISGDRLSVFDVSDPGAPAFRNSVAVGFGIETLFARDTALFIGARDGMHVYDISDPDSPAPLSSFSHVRSCDPVVVEGDLAFVTLRSGGGCWGGQNELQILDVSDLRAPQLLKTFPMVNPHGLGVDGDDLFICDGAAGFKRFRLGEGLSLTLVEHLGGLDAYDVIPAVEGRARLILVSQEGLSQYDYAQTPMRRLSLIPIGG